MRNMRPIKVCIYLHGIHGYFLCSQQIPKGIFTNFGFCKHFQILASCAQILAPKSNYAKIWTFFQNPCKKCISRERREFHGSDGVYNLA